MNKSVVVILLACGVFAGTVQSVAAQTGTWSDRGYINIGFGVESGSSTLTDSKTASIYDETSTITSSGTFASGGVPDFGVGLRVWKNLTVGAAYHKDNNDADSDLTGSIPSPLFFNRPRTLNDKVRLQRKEQATHVVLGWVLPFGSKFDVVLFAGPSFFRLEQEVVSSVRIGENGGTLLAEPTVKTRRKSQTGYNAGVDATYIVWSNDSIRIGAGGFVRFTQASTEVEMLTTSQPTDVGGIQFGFGGRFRF